MAFSVVDEAIRNAVAVGGDPQRLALLDNFCWGDPRRPEILGSLIRAAQGCHDAALYYRTPFISGKDSLNNEYLGSDGNRHAIPGTLLISAIAIHPDVRRAVTMDLKAPGNCLYLVGDFRPALAGSHAVLVAGAGTFAGLSGMDRPPARPDGAPELYQLLHTALCAGLVASAHDLSEGGLAAAAAEMALAGGLGLSLDFSRLPGEAGLALFGETNGCLLVEVRPAQATAFEEAFRTLPGVDRPACLLLGEVAATPALVIARSGETLINLPVSHLRLAFGGGEREKE
jgi:phosphoribosylformylglycinamidine synthase